MARVNLTHADIIASESEEEQDKRAGMAVVRVKPSGATIRRKEWMDTCMEAVDSAFLVKHYIQSFYKRQALNVVFYGLATNAAAAASAYAMVSRLLRPEKISALERLTCNLSTGAEPDP